jgi:4-aminobutyrate aminotransferase/(S)-3-amino-2-methylpropionate transaminase
MARTGKYFASEHFGLVPDLLLSAKGIAGGLPLAGVTGRAEIMDASQPGGLGGTFGGNPVACAAAIAVFQHIEDDGLLARAQSIEATLKPALEKLREQYPIIAEVRGKGAMIAIEFADPATHAALSEVPGKIAAYAAQQGVLVLTAGTYGNVIRFLPSLAITDEQLRDAVGVIGDALAAL